MTQMHEFQRKYPYRPFPHLQGRLHIFPALIPLIELIPWLLGLAGAAATVTPFAIWRRHKKPLLIFAAACFVVALGVVAWKKAHIPTDEEGSRLLAAEDWPKFNALSSLPAGGVADKQYNDFAPVWTAPLKNEPLAGPIVAGDLLLLGTFSATLDAISRIDGKPVWSIKKHEPVFTNPAVLKHAGYVGEGLHTAVSAGITAFSLPEGKILWERQFLSHVESSPLVHEDEHRLWTGAGDQSLWCLDTRDGSAVWRRKIGHIDSTPLIAGGTLFVTSWPDTKVKQAKLFALDPANGDEKWSAELAGGIMGSPQPGPAATVLVTTANGQVGPQVATDKGWAHAISADGKLLWTVELPGISLPEPSVLAEKELVIHTLKTGQIVALHVKDGTTAWTVTLGKQFDAPAVLRADTNPPLLAAVTTDGAVSILDAEGGTEIRRFNVKQGGYAPPVFDGDILYVTTPRDITAYGGVHLLTRGTK
ncbi:MAG: PQQ-binding-like beta-propeller repeat protein [Alphaproteobacteria bacterium]